MFISLCVTLWFMRVQISREQLLIQAMKYYHLPYIWGGSGPLGYDCSGLCEAMYKEMGLAFPGRMNSQQIFNTLLNNPKVGLNEADLGDLVFFGTSLDGITHIGFCLGNGLMFEASHGDHTCTTAEIAYARGAMVMVNPILHRRDCVAIVKMPLDWPPTSAPTSAPA